MILPLPEVVVYKKLTSAFSAIEVPDFYEAASIRLLSLSLAEIDSDYYHHGHNHNRNNSSGHVAE